MGILSERLEIRLSTSTMQLLRHEAEQRGIPLARLVREAIDQFLREDIEARKRAAEALFSVEAPVSDWDAMKREVEEAYLKGGAG